VQVRQIPITLIQIEAVPDEELVRHHEADVADREILDEAPVRAVEQRHCGERRRRTQGEGLTEVVERQPGVDHVLDDEDVPARQLGIEVLEQPDPRVAAGVGAGRIAGELQEVEAVRDSQRPREIGREDEARLERSDEQRLEPFVVAGDLTAQLADARLQLLVREVDLTKARASAYDASSSRYLSARRSMSRL
jgi:hypothetical protein